MRLCLPDLCVIGAAIARVFNTSQVRFDSSCWHQCEQQLEGRTAEAVISKSNTIILHDFFFFRLKQNVEGILAKGKHCKGHTLDVASLIRVSLGYYCFL